MIDLFWFIGLFGFQLVLVVAMIGVHNSFKVPNLIDSDQGLSVIIPFRNEEKRIQPLLESISQSDLEGIELIFINDGSEDETEETIRRILHLEYQIKGSQEHRGKKMAIQMGVEAARFENILTLDADVQFNPDYLQIVRQLPHADLTILPVRLSGNKIIERLGTVEFMWLQLLTFVSLKFGVPFLCNGANLKFSKKSFLESITKRKDLNIASGEDVFLLDSLRRLGKKVSGFSDYRLQVQTPAPGSMKELLKQRKRWIGKMTKQPHILMFLSVLVYFITLFGLFYCVFASFSSVYYLIPVGIKLIVETLIIGNVYKNNDLLWHGLLPVFHQVFYPVYLIRMLFPVASSDRWTKNEY